MTTSVMLVQSRKLYNNFRQKVNTELWFHTPVPAEKNSCSCPNFRASPTILSTFSALGSPSGHSNVASTLIFGYNVAPIIYQHVEFYSKQNQLFSNNIFSLYNHYCITVMLNTIHIVDVILLQWHAFMVYLRLTII